MEEEEWKPVRGFEEYAEISNLGQIHKFERVIYFGTNHHSKRIQEEDWTYGCECGDYLYATIGGVKKGVHVWVYETFNDCDIPQGLEVNHIDENKHNNRLDNLNLLSHGDNMRYGTGIERRSAALRGRKQTPEHIARHAAAKSKAVQALDPKTLEIVYEFPSAAEAQRQYGFHTGAVSECCRNCYSTHNGNIYKGYIWRYAVQ